MDCENQRGNREKKGITWGKITNLTQSKKDNEGTDGKLNSNSLTPNVEQSKYISKSKKESPFVPENYTLQKTHFKDVCC